MLREESRTNIGKRLNRISGQVAGIRRMVDEDRYCVDVLLQIAAVRAALAKVAGVILENHVQHCVGAAFSQPDAEARQAKIDELLRVFEKYCG